MSSTLGIELEDFTFVLAALTCYDKTNETTTENANFHEPTSVTERFAGVAGMPAVGSSLPDLESASRSQPVTQTSPPGNAIRIWQAPNSNEIVNAISG